jgi:hypothetical protein
MLTIFISRRARTHKKYARVAGRSKIGYIQNLMPVCLSFSFLSGLGSFHQVSHQTNNRYILCSVLNKSCQTLTNSATITDCAALGLRQRILLNQGCMSFGILGGLDW